MFPSQRGRRRNNRRTLPRNARRIAQNSKMINGAAPIRVQANKQLISIPDHNYQLRLRKMIRTRFQIVVPGTDFGYAAVFAAVRAELGVVENTLAGEVITLHGARFYNAETNDLGVVVYDRENSGTAVANAISHFVDSSSSAGICHVSFIYPVQDRPSFNRSQTNVSLFRIESAFAVTVIIDLDVTYSRTTIDAIPFATP